VRHTLPPLPPRLIATDLDGTLLQRDGTISTRTQYALVRVRAYGIPVVMVTGRPPRHVRQLAGTAQLAEMVICMNGALTYDLDARQVLDETRLPAPEARSVVRALRRLFPEICFAVEVGLAFGWEPQYARERGKVEPSDLGAEDALALCADGVNKLIAFSSIRPLSEEHRRFNPGFPLSRLRTARPNSAVQCQGQVEMSAFWPSRNVRFGGAGGRSGLRSRGAKSQRGMGST
jgi:hydroxymethylpyrimidine pyrophosphatase-like HAD family hydrolase